MLPLTFVQLFSFSLVCQFLALLLHLLLRSPLPPLLSVLLVFYLNPNILPHYEEARSPPRAIFVIKNPPKTICFLISLAVCLKIFKCLTMKTNAHLPLFSRQLLLPCKNALSGLLWHCSKPHIQPRRCSTLSAKFCPDAVKVWLPAERCNHRPCCISYFSELLLSCTANHGRCSVSRSYSTGEQDNLGLNALQPPPLSFLKSLATKACLVTTEKTTNRWTVWVLQKRKIIPMVHNMIQQAR